MTDLLLKSLPTFLAPAPIVQLQRCRVRLRRRGGCNFWGLSRKSGVGVSELDIVYSSESSDGSVLFRFGTASEIAEYVASQKALNVNDGVETDVEDVDDGVVEENHKGDDKDGGEDTVEGLADGLGDTILLVDDLLKGSQGMPVDLEDQGVDCTLDSSEILSGEQISRDEAGVSCAPCPDIISSVVVEEPSVHEDKDGSLETRNLDVVENSSSDEVDSESGFGEKSSTLENTSDYDGDGDLDFECSLEKKIVTVGSVSAFDETYGCNAEREKVNDESDSGSADDFEGDEGMDNMYSETSGVSDENSEGNTEKELLIVENIISDEDMESYGRDHSTSLENTIIVDEDNDPTALEPDVIESSSLKDASHHVVREDVFSPVVSVISIISPDENINGIDINTAPIAENAGVSGFDTDSNANSEILANEETRTSDGELESDDKEIPVVSEISIISPDENINSLDINTALIAENAGVSGFDTDSNADSEILAIEETRTSDGELESDDEEIPVLNGSLTFDEEMGCDSDKEIVALGALQKTNLSEVLLNEDTHNFNSLDAVSIVEPPSADEISNQKNYFDTGDAAGSPPGNLFTGEGGFSHRSGDETSMMNLDMAARATSSVIQEDTDGSNSIAAIPVATQLDAELILDERIDFGIDEGFVGRTGIGSLNLNDAKATQTTEVSEADSTSKNGAPVTAQKPPQLVGDREEASPVSLSLCMGAALLPQSSEPLTAGEDAYFIAGEAWFGVADGVGQWSLEGVDAGLYGHELMECCRRIVSNGGSSRSTNPKEVLSRSAAEATLPGSATVLVAYFDGQVLHASNVGDTGFIIVRNGVVLSSSSPTVHDFHFPHQIKKGDDPLEFVECYDIELDEGDVIIAATDGLFDNLYKQEIASVVTESLQASMSPEETAAVLAVKAQEIGRSTSTRSPFADAAQASGYAGYTGGKLDDVAVIVSVVQKKS